MIALSLFIPHVVCFLVVRFLLRVRGDAMPTAGLAVRYAVLLRISLFGFGFLVFVVPLLRLTQLSANVVVLERASAVGLVGAAGMLTASACLWTMFLSARYVPERVRVMPLGLGPFLARLAGRPSLASAHGLATDSFRTVRASSGLLHVLTAMGLTLPLLIAAYGYSPLAVGSYGAGALLGLLCGAGMLFAAKLIGIVMYRVVEPRLPSFRGLRFILRGYIHRRTGRLYAGHFVAIGSTIVLVGIYTVFATLFDASQPWVDRIPMFAVVLFLAALVVVVLGGAAFFFDRLRLPVIVVMVVWSLVNGAITKSRHEFAVRDNSAPGPTTVAQSISGSEEPLIIVCAAGGGIQAAGWTAKVLTELDASVPDFSRRVELVSSVSGGSVGAMYYLEQLARLDELRQLTKEERDAVFEAATASSLSAVGLALVFQDLRRPLVPFVNRDEDRGTALEAVWRRRLDPGTPIDSTLKSWASSVRAKKLPAVAFNATIAGAAAGDLLGHRMVFSTVDLRNGAKEFFSTYGADKDIDVVTAARLSATFPYISPIARGPEGRGAEFGMADGGYHDNLGFTTALQWLDEARKATPEKKRKVAFVLIDPFPPEKSEKVDASLGAWKDALFGPLTLILSVRSTTQEVRTELEQRLLDEIFGGNRNEVMLNGKTAGQGRKESKERFGVFTFKPTEPVDKDNRTPLSWHLTSKQVRRIREGWDYEGFNEKTARALRQFLKTRVR